MTFYTMKGDTVLSLPLLRERERERERERQMYGYNWPAIGVQKVHEERGV